MCFLRISLPQRTLAAQPRFWIRTRFLSGKSSLVPFIWYFGAMRSQRGQSGRGWEWASANTYLLVTNRLLDVVRAVGKKTNFMWHIPSSIHQELWWVMNADVFSSQTKVIYIYMFTSSHSDSDRASKHSNANGSLVAPNTPNVELLDTKQLQSKPSQLVLWDCQHRKVPQTRFAQDTPMQWRRRT